MKKIVKEIDVNESVLTLYNTVNSIYNTMYHEMPDNIKEETRKFLYILATEKEKGFPEKMDIADNKIIDVVTFVKDERF